MWRRRFLLKSRPPRVSDAAISLGRSDDDQKLRKNNSRKKETKKRRQITDSNTDKGKRMRKIDGEDEVPKSAGEDENSDRLSALPDSIIHHIFDFTRCTKDVVRTTLLSKNWKRVFDSYQTFDFDERRFRSRRVEEYEAYVNKSLARRLERVEGVNKFKLYTEKVDLLCIAEWIRAAMAKNVKELDVTVVSWEDCYAWPFDMTQSSSITFLKVTGRSLRGLAAMKMSNLRRISFKDAAFLDVDLMKKLVENSQLLEDLRIIHCAQLSSLEISSLAKLKRVEVQECRGVKRIEIASPNLETFWFHAKEKQKCIINLKCKEKLRNVTLKDRKMSESVFEDCISMCPMLEKLELFKCNKIEKLRICSQTLKSLALSQCAKLNQVDVDAPNLYSFQYEGSVMSFPFIKAPHLAEVKFSFKHYNKRSNAKCENFFYNFDGCKGFKLTICSRQNMKIFEDPREADLSQSEGCKIELTASSSKVVKNVDSWLRECHGKSLDIVSSNGELLKLINTLIIDREDNPSCCRVHSSNKCWRHYIEDVKVSTSESVEKTSYNLTWRSRNENKNNYLIDGLPLQVREGD